MNINQEIKKGAFWVLLFSLIGGPMAVIRNWLITFYDPSGIYIGEFALTMILFNIITSFFIFGGSSVLTNFVPKVDRANDKGRFLLSYSIICLVLFLVIVILLILFPNAIAFITNGKIDSRQNIPLLLMALPVILAQLIIYYLQGKTDYKTSSFLNQLPNFLNTAVVLVLIILSIPIKSLTYNSSLILFLSSIIIGASIITIVIGIYTIWDDLISVKIKFSLPKGFWNFSIFVHLMTLLTFAYQNIDQIFVYKIVGLKDLGYYFIIIQLVEIVRFIPLKIGQVLLASFSKIIHSGDEQMLISTYKKVGRIIIWINLSLSIILICFASDVMHVFGVNGTTYSIAFIILLFAYNIGCIGNLNSMVLLANNQSRPYFFNNLLLVVVLVVGLNFLGVFNLIGIVFAKSFAILIGQLGLFYLIKKYVGFKRILNRDYLFGQIFLFFISLLFLLIPSLNLLLKIILSVSFLIIAFKYYRLSLSELKMFIVYRK